MSRVGPVSQHQAAVPQARIRGRLWRRTAIECAKLGVTERDKLIWRWKNQASYSSTETYIEVGWPGCGSVYVSDNNKAFDLGVAIVENTENMEERYRTIERLGGFSTLISRTVRT